MGSVQFPMFMKVNCISYTYSCTSTAGSSCKREEESDDNRIATKKHFHATCLTNSRLTILGTHFVIISFMFNTRLDSMD